MCHVSSANEEQGSPFRAVQKNSSQAAKGHLGHLDAKDANRPFRPKRKILFQAVRDMWDKSTRQTRIAEGAEGQSMHATCHRQNEGRESPFRADRRFLSQTTLGHPGQMDAMDAKEPAGPRTNRIATRVAGERVQRSKSEF